MRLLTIALFLCVLVTSSSAATFFVYPDGSGTYVTIQDAVDASEAGDSIFLMPGLFSGPGNRDITIDHDLSIKGSATTSDIEIIIDLEGSEDEFHRAFNCQASDVVFEDFGIINGYSTSGGAIYIEEGSATISGCLFQNNVADQRGGACSVTEEAMVFFDHCMFGGNFAGSQGGAIYASVESEIQLTYCSLAANGAPNGSAVYLAFQAYCDIERTIIAFGNGGAACETSTANTFTAWTTDVFHNAGGDWTHGLAGLEGGTNNSSLDPQFVDPMGDPANYELSHFSPCGTPYPGGLIGAKMMDVANYSPIYNVAAGTRGMFADLSDAVATVPAGAVIVMESGVHQGSGYQDVEWDGKDLVLRGRTGDPADCTINIDGSDGDLHRALTVTDLTDASIIEGITFINGWAYKGGVLNIQDSSGPKLQDCIFRNNLATSNGGAIYAENWTYDLADCLFELNQVPSGLHGGAMALEKAGGVMNRCDFRENLAGYLAGRGGAVYLNNHELEMSTVIDFLSCDFLDNTSENQGGGLYIRNSITDPSQITLSGCALENNSSDAYGGAFMVRQSLGAGSTLILENCQVQGNESRYYGGGGYVWNMAVSASECVFINNNSDGGGGMYLLNCESAQFTECRFEENVADTGSGGGLNLVSVGWSQFLDTSFRNNTCDNYGGGLASENSPTHFEFCSFLNNNSDYFGGGFSCAASDTTVVSSFESCIFSGNTAHDSGAAIAAPDYEPYPIELTMTQCTVHGNAVIGNSVLNETAVVSADPIDSLNFNYCLFTDNDTDHLVINRDGEPLSAWFYCSDIHGNVMGDWVGYIADQLDDEGNMSANPQYCDEGNGVFTLNILSPCLPDNNECSTQIGARGHGCNAVVGVPDGETIPAVLAIGNNYPNPFNPSTTIEYSLPQAGTVRIAIYDAAGRLVRQLVDGGMREAGRHSVVWDGRDGQGRTAGSGIYLARLSANGGTSVRRMVMLK